MADNETDVSTLYQANGTKVALTVAIPGGAPTGLVANAGSSFVVTDGPRSGASRFIFATQSGVIAGWNPAVARRPKPWPPSPTRTRSTRASRSPGSGSTRRTSSARASTCSAATFNLIVDPDAFVDPRLPAGFAPFGIQNIGGTIFVAYAKQDEEEPDEEVAGQGLGLWTPSTRAGICSDASRPMASSTRRGASPARRRTSAGSAAISSSATSATARSRLRAGPNGSTTTAGRSRNADQSRSPSTASGRSSSARASDEQWADEHAVLHRRPRRGDPRPLRHDHSRLAHTVHGPASFGMQARDTSAPVLESPKEECGAGGQQHEARPNGRASLSPRHASTGSARRDRAGPGSPAAAAPRLSRRVRDAGEQRVADRRDELRRDTNLRRLLVVVGKADQLRLRPAAADEGDPDRQALDVRRQAP